MALQAKNVKHGMHVTISGNGAGDRVWEVLDRSPRANQWWLHRRDNSGEWQTTEAHITSMTAAGAGSRQECLLTEALAA
jgi:hypothetical protein